MNREEKILWGALVFVVSVCIVGVAATIGDDYETGVVRAKKDGALYVSPVNDTLVGRKILFPGNTRHGKGYEVIQIADTIKFRNPTRAVVVDGYRNMDMQINNKNIQQAIEQFDKNKQLQQIQREWRQK